MSFDPAFDRSNLWQDLLKMSHIKAFLILLYWPPDGVTVRFDIIRSVYVESPAHKHDLLQLLSPAGH